MKKVLMLPAGICGILVSVYILYASIVDIAVPKPVWLVMACCTLVSAVINFTNYRNGRKQ